MKKFMILILLIFIISTCFFIYDKTSHINIIVKFNDLEPLERSLPVYLKGFRIGKTTKVYPDKDFQNTYISLKLNSKNFNLPKNISAKIVKGKIGGYINLIYPEAPEIARIKNNDEIMGKTTKDIDKLINERFVDEELEGIVDNATNLIENANITVKNLGVIFTQISTIIDENHFKINKAVNNLMDTTNSLKEMANKLNTGIRKDGISNSFNNIEDMTNQINNETIPILNNILCEVNEASKNANEITKGIKKTLKERMGLSKLLLGRPIKD